MDLEEKVEESNQQIKDLKAELKIKDKRMKDLEGMLEEKQVGRQKQNLVVLLKKALEMGVLHEHHFMYKWLQNSLKNLTSSPTPQGFRYTEEIIHWSLLIRFYGGSAVFDVLRGARGAKTTQEVLEQQNLILPSLSTLKRWLPEYTFGGLDEEIFKELFDAVCQNKICPFLMVSWDEMEIRHGLVYCPRQAKIVGWIGETAQTAEDVYKRQKKVAPQDLAKNVCQFFLVTLDGLFCAPVLHAGFDPVHPKDFLTECMKKIQRLVAQASGNRLQIVAGSSDGAPGSFKFATSQTVFPKYRHISDFSHIIKRMRNHLINSSISLPIDGEIVEFSIYTLSEVGREDEILKELLADGEIISPQDRMEMEPVMKLLDCQIRERLQEYSTAAVKGLKEFLDFMNDFYQLFRCVDLTRECKIRESHRLLKVFQNWQQLSRNLLPIQLCEEVHFTLFNVMELLKEFPHVQINLCSLSTLMVEHYFSTIRYKTKCPSMIEYCRLTKIAWLRLQAVLAERSPFQLAKRSLSKCYNNVNLVIPYKPLMRRQNLSTGSLEDVAVQEYAEELASLFKPKSSTLLLREYFFKNPPEDGNLKNRILLTCKV